MTHPLDKPLGPIAQRECHWSHHDGTKTVYDFMCLFPLDKTEARIVVQTMEMAIRQIARANGLEEEEAND